MNSIARLVEQLPLMNMKNVSGIKVSAAQYAAWEQQWLFDAISGLRLGESFCKYFGVPRGTPLYYFRDNNLSLRWIKDNYMEDEAEVR